MSIKEVFLLSVCLCLVTACKNDKILKLPITYHKGYGPFESSGGNSIPLYIDVGDNPWKKTFLKVSGVPQHWTNVKIGDINSNRFQYVYQNYHSGHISKEWYEKLKSMWNWEPDTLNLSKEPLKCRAAFAIGMDSVGNRMAIVDANNNYDFSDDKPFIPVGFDRSLNMDSMVSKQAINVNFERLLNNKKIGFQAPLIITHLNQDWYLLCEFAQYGTAELNGYQLSIQSARFRDLSYKDVKITTNKTRSGEKIEPSKLVLNNEYLEIGGDFYKNLGVQRNRDYLLLEKTDTPKSQIRSTQIGFKAFDFSGKPFENPNPISLERLEGKYVLLDFWRTSCGYCIQDIPNLKTLYSKADKTKFEIISIVADSPIEDLERLVDKHGITWPQIISNKTNQIKEIYGVQKYPSTFLLNPEGVVIAKDLRGEELETKIDSILN
jgi:peroxiredoxin